MFKFDLVNLQGAIEEKRLILAQKIEKFLLQKLNLFFDYFKKIFEKNLFFFCLAPVLTSIIVRSTRDIGPGSGLNLLSLNLPIICAEILVNLLGIISIYFSFLILRKTEIAKNKILFNLTITSFAIGFFLRIYTLQFNEFITKTSLILALFFPFLSYQFLKKNKIEKVATALLGIALFAILFSLIDFKNVNYFLVLREDIIPVFLIVFLGTNVTKGFKPLLALGRFIESLNLNFSGSGLKPQTHAHFLPSLLIYTTLLLTALPDSYDYRTIFYSISLPLIAMVIYQIKDLVNWRRDALIIIFILSVPQFDAKNFFNIALYFFILCFCFYIPFRATRRERQFNKIDSIIIFTAISYILSLYLAAIFSYNSPSLHYKSPNKISEEMLQTINFYQAKEVVIISDSSYSAFPLANYSKSLIKWNMSLNTFPDLIFIEKKHYNFDNECKIGALETTFKNPEFKKYFSANYVFLNRLTSTKSYKKNIEFFADKEIPEMSLDHEIIERDFEVYARR